MATVAVKDVVVALDPLAGAKAFDYCDNVCKWVADYFNQRSIGNLLGSEFAVKGIVKLTVIMNAPTPKTVNGNFGKKGPFVQFERILENKKIIFRVAVYNKPQPACQVTVFLPGRKLSNAKAQELALALAAELPKPVKEVPEEPVEPDSPAANPIPEAFWKGLKADHEHMGFVFLLMAIQERVVLGVDEVDDLLRTLIKSDDLSPINHCVEAGYLTFTEGQYRLTEKGERVIEEAASVPAPPEAQARLAEVVNGQSAPPPVSPQAPPISPDAKLNGLRQKVASLQALEAQKQRLQDDYNALRLTLTDQISVLERQLSEAEDNLKDQLKTIDREIGKDGLSKAPATLAQIEALLANI
jgi:hypothetical protein